MHRLPVYCNREVSTECLGLILPFCMFSGLKRLIYLNKRKCAMLFVANLCAIQIKSHGMASCGITTQKKKINAVAVKRRKKLVRHKRV